MLFLVMGGASSENSRAGVLVPIPMFPLYNAALTELGAYMVSYPYEKKVIRAKVKQTILHKMRYVLTLFPGHKSHWLPTWFVPYSWKYWWELNLAVGT